MRHPLLTSCSILLVLSLASACGDPASDDASSETPAGEIGPEEPGDADGGDAATAGTDDMGSSADAEIPDGPPRGDLDRFYGVYGDPDGRRNFSVAEARPAPGSDQEVPEGHLMIAATWGDVAPWYMRPVGDARFEQIWAGPYQDEPLIAEFELDEDGSATALTFETMFDDRGRLERIGDLREGG